MRKFLMVARAGFIFLEVARLLGGCRTADQGTPDLHSCRHPVYLVFLRLISTFGLWWL